MTDLFTYPFFWRTISAAFLASVACGIIGTYIVSRRIVFLGGSIAHASFGGIGIAYYLGLNPVLGAGIFAVISALAVQRLSQSGTMRTDSMIGIIWSFGMATGIIFIFLSPGYAPNLMSYLFGSILTVTIHDIAAMGIVTFIICIFFTMYLREILYISFDGEFALTRGMPVTLFNYILTGLAALTIVISIRVAGIILVISMLTIPQVTAGLFTSNFRKMILLSVIFAFASSITGLAVSFYASIPSGASIIFSSIIIFIAARLFKFFSAEKINRNN